MEKTVIHVEGMACAHCVKAVTGALLEQPGVEKVQVDLQSKTAAVEFDPAQSSLEQLHAAIEEQGYEVKK